MVEFDHSGRVQRLQGLMGEIGVGAALLSVGPDLPYFIGYESRPSERLTMLVVPVVGEPILLVPRLEAPLVSAGDFEVLVWDETDSAVELVAKAASGADKILIGDHTWSVFLIGLQRELAGSSWAPASTVTRHMRSRKDAAEIESLRSAAHAVDRVLDRVQGEVAFAGRTESEIAGDLRRMTVEEGHEVAEFAIVASGPNGASPHHDPGGRVVAVGDLVICDFGGRLDAYYSDVTRTFSVGTPTDEQIEVHQVVLAANQAGRDAVATGVRCEEVDRAARKVVVEAGYGEAFIHRTGHGIGLEVHEHPYLVEGNDALLETGMAFSIEPGIYLPGRLGVRIEDIAVCASEGIDVLNRADRGLVVVS